MATSETNKLFRTIVQFFRSRKQKKQPECEEIIPEVFKLNDDCLEKIFSYLKLRDLYFVAKADERFVRAACWQFKRKIGRGLIKIDCFEILINSDHSTGLRIHIKDSSCVDTFFENFGPAIRRLEVYIRGYRNIDRIILKHCSDLLAEIQVYRTWSAPKKGSRWHSCFWSMAYAYYILTDFISRENE